MAWKGSGVQFPSAPRKKAQVRGHFLEGKAESDWIGMSNRSVTAIGLPGESARCETHAAEPSLDPIERDGLVPRLDLVPHDGQWGR